MTVEAAGDETLHRVRQCGMRCTRGFFVGKFGKHAGTGTAHARSTELAQPVEMLRDFGIERAGNRLQIVAADARSPCSCRYDGRIAAQFGRLEYLRRRHGDRWSEYQIPGSGQVDI